MTLDFNRRPSFADRVNAVVDQALTADQAMRPPRDYLGGSRLGHACERALQFEFTATPKDEGQEFTGQTLRIFRGAGDVINPSHLGGEVIILAPDERAVAIHVTDAAGLAGLIRPGDTVGVTAVMESQDGPFAKTVASGLRVLYISPEFKASQGGQSTSSTSSSSGDPFAGGGSTASQGPRETEGTVVLAVPVDAITIGYDFSTFGVNSESRLVSLTDLLPALDLVANVQLSLFLEPDQPQSFITSGVFLPNLVITPGPTPTATPCPGGICAPSTTPTAVVPIP